VSVCLSVCLSVLDLAHDKSTRIDARYSEFDIQGTLVWVYFWVGQVTVKV